MEMLGQIAKMPVNWELMRRLAAALNSLTSKRTPPSLTMRALSLKSSSHIAYINRTDRPTLQTLLTVETKLPTPGTAFLTLRRKKHPPDRPNFLPKIAFRR